MTQLVAQPDANPFSTRRTRPGAIEYVFAAGTSAETLLTTLGRHAWWGQIVGPHGSGKSTLIATLTTALCEKGRGVERLKLTEGRRSLPWTRNDARGWDRETQVIVDGYEQLSWHNRLWLTTTCRARGCGLLVTAHRPLGLPTLLQTHVTPELAWDIVARLFPHSPPRLSRDDVERCFVEHDGNMRETLFALYDLYELRR